MKIALNPFGVLGTIISTAEKPSDPRETPRVANGANFSPTSRYDPSDAGNWFALDCHHRHFTHQEILHAYDMKARHLKLGDARIHYALI